MKTIWTILHLDTPTNDIEKIKQAYSNLTKQYNPEEQPEKFQEIHNAYKQAIKYAKSQNKTKSEVKNISEDISSFEKNINSKIILDNNIKDYEYQEQNISFENILKKQQEKEQDTLNEKSEFKNKEQETEIENEFSNLYEKNIIEKENIESFENYIIDQNEDVLINQMLYNIEKWLKKSYQDLKKVVSSDDFQKALKYEKFQFELSKLLINNPNIIFKNAKLIQKNCKKFMQTDSKNKLIKSLEKYLINLDRKKSEQKKYSVIAILIVIAFMIFGSAMPNVSTNNTAKNITQNFPTAKNLTTLQSEIRTFDRTIVKYGIPEGFIVNQISDSYKTLKKEKSDVKISISSKYTGNKTYEYFLNEDIEYYKQDKELYSDVKLTILEDIEIENNIYHQAEISYTNNENKSRNKKETHIWIQVSDYTTLYFEIENIEYLTEEELNTLLKIEVGEKQTEMQTPMQEITVK